MPSSAPRTARRRDVVAFVLVVCAIVALDQVTKAQVRSMLAYPGASAPFLPGLLKLELVENTGAAFSMGEGGGVAFALIALVIAVAACAYVAVEEPPLSVVVPLACVAGGGLGNMIDRLAAGRVTDFFATTFIDFPVFNVADIFVTCGVVVAFFAILADDGRRAAASEGQDDE